MITYGMMRDSVTLNLSTRNRRAPEGRYSGNPVGINCTVYRWSL